MDDRVDLLSFDRCELDGSRGRLDGEPVEVCRGHWAFYVPGRNLKLLHSFAGRLHCTHPSAPDRAVCRPGRTFPVGQSYACDDWIAAYTKPVAVRAAETFIAADRLAAAGIGPRVRALVCVQRFAAEFTPAPEPTFGMVVDDLTTYRRRWWPASERQMRRAGVEVDRIRSSVRQQIRNYVSDLNSVVGVMPIDADDEIAAVAERLAASVARPQPLRSAA